MPDDEGMQSFRHQQGELHASDGGGSSDDSLSARTLTIALFVVVGVLVVLLVLLIR